MAFMTMDHLRAKRRVAELEPQIERLTETNRALVTALNDTAQFLVNLMEQLPEELRADVQHIVDEIGATLYEPDPAHKVSMFEALA